MKNTHKTIDLLTDWQRHFVFGLGEVILTEKNLNNEVVCEVIMSTNQFDKIVGFYEDDFKLLNKESLIYQYFNRNYVDGNEDWATDNEEKIEDIIGFLQHLRNIDTNSEMLMMVKKEYDFLLNFCNKLFNNKHQFYFKADNY